MTHVEDYTDCKIDFKSGLNFDLTTINLALNHDINFLALLNFIVPNTWLDRLHIKFNLKSDL